MMQENNKTNLYVVLNGVGKCILFSNMIKELAELNGGKISIASSFPDLFKEHPLVLNSIPAEMSNKQLLKQYFDKILYFEPYYSEYKKGDDHILDVWRKGYDLSSTDYDNAVEIYTDPFAKEYYKNVLEAIKKQKFIVVQLKGGTVSKSGPPPLSPMMYRNFKNDYPLLKALHDSFEKYYFIIVKTANDNYDPKIENLPRLCVLEDEPILVVQEIVNNCSTFVGIDSCVQHMACNKNHQHAGVVLWNNITSPNQIGHTMHINLQSDTIEYVDVDIDLIVSSVQRLLNVDL